MSRNMNGRQERLLRRIEAAWTDLRDSYSGLSEAELVKPGVVGRWSVKDVLAHVTTWDEEALKHLPTVAKGSRPPRYADQGGIDAFNARTAEEKSALSLGEVLERMDATHARLVELVHQTADDQVADRARFVRRLRLDTYGHYALHARAIREWRGRSA